MKKLFCACAGIWAAASMALADAESACKMLPGTYAEAGKPAKPVLSVARSNEQFIVTDLAGKKAIIRAVASDRGLLIVKDPAVTNAFLLSFSPETGDYIFRHLGRASDGKPLPDEPAHSKKLIKITPAAPKAPAQPKVKP